MNQLGARLVDVSIGCAGRFGEVIRTSCPNTGHFGASKTKALISQQFYWPKMGRQIKDYCRTCPVCLQWNNHKEPKLLAMDIVGPLPLTKDGYRYLIDFGTRLYR